MTIALPAVLSLFSVRVSKFIGRRFKSLIAVAAMLAGLCILLAWGAGARPREWAAGEVPVAFWCWQSDVPSQASVQRAIDRVGARFGSSARHRCADAVVVQVRGVVKTDAPACSRGDDPVDHRLADLDDFISV